MAMSNTSFVVRSDLDGISTLLLNRPESRNALSLGMLRALLEHLEQIATDPAVRVVILAGTGPAFCAGHDLKEIRAQSFSSGYAKELFAECAKLMLGLVRLPKPVIARVHGVATAAGCQLVASCDLAVAAQNARFATPGVNVGLFCSTPMVALTRNVGRKAAMRMLLTGELVDAEAAIRIGLINEVAPEHELVNQTATLAGKIAARSSTTLAIGKEAFWRQAELPLAEAYALTSELMVKNLAQRDAQEGIEAFIDKRTPMWLRC
jgi:enoyl-CoA hydratase/carnithine racemase